MEKQDKNCRTQEQCRQVIVEKCLKGNPKACQVIKKAIEAKKNG